MAQYVYTTPKLPRFKRRSKPGYIVPSRFQRPFPGNGYFTGQILIGTVPKQATVEVYHAETKVYVTSTESDVSGVFVIMGVKENEMYDLIAIDPNGEWEKKVSSRRVPKIWPP